VRDHPERQIERRRPGLGPSARTICASTPAFDCDDRTAPSRWSLNDISRNDKGRSIEIVVSGSLIANDFPTMLGAAVEGVDLVQVPEPIAAEPLRAGKLVQRLEPFAPMAPGVFLQYPGGRQMMPKLRAFIDHVKSRSDAANRTRSPIDDRRGKRAREADASPGTFALRTRPPQDDRPRTDA
jgi:DNA-binding transcriptional LysR family regulator